MVKNWTPTKIIFRWQAIEALGAAKIWEQKVVDLLYTIGTSNEESLEAVDRIVGYLGREPDPVSIAMLHNDVFETFEDKDWPQIYEDYKQHPNENGVI